MGKIGEWGSREVLDIDHGLHDSQLTTHYTLLTSDTGQWGSRGEEKWGSLSVSISIAVFTAHYTLLTTHYTLGSPASGADR